MRIAVIRDWQLYVSKDPIAGILWVYFGIVSIPHAYVRLVGYVTYPSTQISGNRNYTVLYMGEAGSRVVHDSEQAAVACLIALFFDKDGYMQQDQRHRWIDANSQHVIGRSFLERLVPYAFYGGT